MSPTAEVSFAALRYIRNLSKHGASHDAGRHMSQELTLLTWSVALTLVQMVIAVVAAGVQVGLPMLAGSREDMPPLVGWAFRAQRAHFNMLESLVLFAIVVIIADTTSRENAQTVLGAQLFFWARLAYAIVYIAGVPWLRTAVWAVSMAGVVLIFLQLF
jgi:uncharacterized MAPEG superfamily protein